MKTRRSLSNLETVAKTDGGDTPSKRKSLSKICRTPTSSKKEVNNVTTTSESRVNLNSDGNSERSLPPNVYNSPIVRILRSRVVTSDNEDEVKSTRTPKRRLSRGSSKEEKSFDSENDKTSAKAEAKKSPESGKKRLSRQNLFSIIEIEENEDTAKSVASIQDEKTARVMCPLNINEESISKDIIMEEDSSKTENINKSKSRGNESVKSPASARKRSSLLSESKETPSKAEGKKKEKTPKSSGKRSSFESEFQVVAVDESEDRVKTIESVSSVKDLEFKDTSSSLEPAEQFDFKKSSVITSDNTGRDEGSSVTDEEYITKERLTEENSSDTESVDTKSKSGGKEIVKTASVRKRSSIITENKETPSKECVDSKSKAMENKERTPASAKKRSSIKESSETPFRVEGKKGKTPKSSEKRFSSKGSIQVVEKDENEDRVNTKENLASLKDGAVNYKFSHTEIAEEFDSEKSSVIEGDKFRLDGGSSDADEEYITKDRITEKKSSETECVDTKPKSESKERVKTSSRKRSSLITENEETPPKVEGTKEKTPKSSAKRFSFQDSFKVVEMLEHGDSNDSHQGHHDQDTRISESEGSDDFLSSKESEEIEREEMGNDIKSEDKITGKGKRVKMSADVSSGESLLQRAMVMTSLAIQKEKKLMKTPKKSEKMFVEAAAEEESSEDSEEPQSEEMTQQTDVIEEDDSDSGSDSEDDVPESISFESGKEQMNQAVKMAVEAIQREKERIKEQRRKRMEMIRIQKKEKEQRQMEKLKMLEMKMPKRLSEDIVNRLPDAPEIPTIKDPAAKKKKKKNKMQVKDVEMVELKKNKITKFDDYIPLDDVKAATKFGIVPLDVMEKIPKSASEKAAEFKRQALFGSRIRREPSKNLLSYKQKIGAAFKSNGVNQQQRFKPY